MENISESVINEIKKVVSGKDEIIKKVVSAVFAGGSVLLEDVPGVGKTTLALAVSKAFGLKFKRIQFTPDTVASDIMGYTAYDSAAGKFVYHEGAAMTNILLADEINRTSGKTQSALLEVMEEGTCTVDGVKHEVLKPFSVIATQNPSGSAGTSKLPQSQLDRFLIKLKMGYPDKDSMRKILQERHHSNPLDDMRTVCTLEELLETQEKCRNVFVDDKIYDYISQLCEESRNSPLVSVGVSPRGALALCKMAKATAFCEGRNYVVPQDIRANFYNVCGHRIILSAKAKIAEKSEFNVLEEVLKSVKSPEVASE